MKKKGCISSSTFQAFNTLDTEDISTSWTTIKHLLETHIHTGDRRKILKKGRRTNLKIQKGVIKTKEEIKPEKEQYKKTLQYSKRMSFLSGSPWQQPGIISGSSGYGQPSSEYQQQQQQEQHKPPNTLSGASIPGVLASSSLSAPSPPSAQYSDWHCQSQMAPGGQVASTTQGGSKITLTENEVKLGQSRTEGTSSGMAAEVPATLSFKIPALKMEDERSRGARSQEEGHGLGGLGASLGSAGQSPSSPLSSHSSPFSSLPSPSSSSGRLPNSALDPKLTTDSFGQNNLQQNYSGNKDGFYIQGFQVSGQGQGLLRPPKMTSGERNTLNPSFTGSTSTSSSPGNNEDQKKSVSSSTSGGLLGSLKENSIAGVTGNQTLKPSLEKGSIDTQPTGTVSPAADITNGKAGSTAGPTAGLPLESAKGATVNVGVGGVRETVMGSGNLSHTEKTRSCIPPSRGKIESGVVVQGLSQDLNYTEDVRAGSCGTLIRETKPSQGSELPQRTAVRRAMSDCSHLSVPTVITGTYPTGMGGPPVMTPNVPNFALMATACPPRAPYPHVAVRRSLTVTGGTEAAAAMATMMSSPLITSHVLPSSPPPKRHHGSYETNFLLPVPPPAAMTVNSSQDSKPNTVGKRYCLCACVCRLDDEKTLTLVASKLPLRLSALYGYGVAIDFHQLEKQSMSQIGRN